MKVVCLGDSLTNGFKEITHYPEILNQYPRLEVINGGKPSANTNEVISQAYRLIPQYRPKLVTILTGLNDIQDDAFKQVTYFMQLKRLVDFLKEYNCTPIIGTLPFLPENTTNEKLNEKRQEVEKINNVLNTFVQIHNVDLVDNHANTQDENLFLDDRFHLNNEGQKIIASNFYRAIQRYRE